MLLSNTISYNSKICPSSCSYDLLSLSLEKKKMMLSFNFCLQHLKFASQDLTICRWSRRKENSEPFIHYYFGSSIKSHLQPLNLTFCRQYILLKPIKQHAVSYEMEHLKSATSSIFARMNSSRPFFSFLSSTFLCVVLSKFTFCMLLWKSYFTTGCCLCLHSSICMMMESFFS